MIKTKFLKAIMLGLCVSTFYTGVAFADTIDSKSAEVTTQDTGAESDLLKLQSEIDQYVFADHFNEIEKKGFTVTQTSQADNYVEIGITPFSDDNANYLYDIFGKDKVKVVKGEEAVLYKTNEAVAPDTAVSSEMIDNDLVTRQDEVNKALFEDKASKLEAKGISIMYTTPLDGYIEVGIRPYNEDNAKFIYDLTGEDKVKVVEGKEPELMATTGLATDDVMTDTAVNDGKEIAQEDSVKAVSAVDKAPAAKKANNILPIAGIVGVAVLLGGAVVLSQKKKITR
ncbi:hypothetical protein [Anaerocolumna xylanovorans]|uniref:Uncharacterized protein n=1 Tax=Anaerocolumna xylanovorans DSM 12503 TaxID=1121345 RepID=A0A1M7YKH4_9FIRM|nr:hypothetical protein [Anaerocolumna xylanovorans]SHO53076.1 hypothetical protein SAMN02745217_03949 [Anaerocolumna xylanovorans DSM 12503]